MPEQWFIIALLLKNDLIEIFWGFMNWKKHPLEYNHASTYLDDIYEVCNKLDKTSYHATAQYQLHKQHGNNVYKYKRNKNTTWYIIYDFDILNNVVFIKHIMPNHTTITEIK